VNVWIKISDQMPDPMTPVLIAWAGYPTVTLGWRAGAFWFDRLGVVTWMQPTHWMPLPQPPSA
jgi:hypothetical protein